MRWLRITRWSAGFFVVLLVAELSVRWLSPFLPEDRWPDPEMEAKREQVDALDRRNEAVDVVFFGCSMTAQNIHPEAFESASGLSIYNAGVSGATPGFIERWALDSILPHLDPTTVVIEVAAWTMNDNGIQQRGRLDELRSARGFQVDADPTPLRRIEARLERWSDLVLHRRVMRDPATLVDAVKSKRRGAQAPRSGLDPHGGRELDPSDYATEPAKLDEYRTEVFNEYSTGGREVAALLRLARTLEERGIDVVFLESPGSEDYEDILSAAGQRDFDASIERIERETGRPVIRTQTDLPNENFLDPFHLDAETGERLSMLLGSGWDDLSEHGGSLDLGPPSR